MRYITVEEVIRINRDILGTEPVIRDAGLLESAVQRPAQVVFGDDAYPGLFDKVAALMESLCQNHAFFQGNKRTAVVAAIHMLNWNGYDLRAEQMELVDITLGVLEHLVKRQALTDWVEQHAVPLELPDVD